MSSGGRIDTYLDFNSPYSYYAFTWLTRHREALAEHGIEIDFHPIFLGGINVGSGNKPPWTLPAKAAYSKFDGPRARRYFQSWELVAPPFFPILSILPMRCMLYIKAHFPRPRFEAQFHELWVAYWKDHLDLSKPEFMTQCLCRHFSEEEAKAILAGATSAEYKKMLTDETAALVAKGAFGAPWHLVRKGGEADGTVEPFFGSDRFHFMLQYLDVPFTDITIQSPKKDAKL